MIRTALPLIVVATAAGAQTVFDCTFDRTCLGGECRALPASDRAGTLTFYPAEGWADLTSLGVRQHQTEVDGSFVSIRMGGIEGISLTTVAPDGELAITRHIPTADGLIIQTVHGTCTRSAE